MKNIEGTHFLGEDAWRTELVAIKSDDPKYSLLENILWEAFPEDERPDLQIQRIRVDTDPRMHCCAIVLRPYESTIGLLTYWDLDGLLYIEHFAVDPLHRGQGYGADALRAFMLIASADSHQMEVSDGNVRQSVGIRVPIVLEVEKPLDETAIRRVRFYERYGLALWPDLGYRQPSYRQNGSPVEMRLMATSDLEPDRFDEVRDKLYRYVYKVT